MSILKEKSTDFAIRSIRMYRYLTETRKEYVISKQFLRSATSIGVNVRESVNAQSKKDFSSKLNIALKEANESQYWLEILFKSGTISEKEFNAIYPECTELAKMLAASVKTVRKNLSKQSK